MFNSPPSFDFGMSAPLSFFFSTLPFCLLWIPPGVFPVRRLPSHHLFFFFLPPPLFSFSYDTPFLFRVAISFSEYSSRLFESPLSRLSFFSSPPRNFQSTPFSRFIPSTTALLHLFPAIDLKFPSCLSSFSLRSLWGKYMKHLEPHLVPSPLLSFFCFKRFPFSARNALPFLSPTYPLSVVCSFQFLFFPLAFVAPRNIFPPSLYLSCFSVFISFPSVPPIKARFLLGH